MKKFDRFSHFWNVIGVEDFLILRHTRRVEEFVKNPFADVFIEAKLPDGGRSRTRQSLERAAELGLKNLKPMDEVYAYRKGLEEGAAVLTKSLSGGRQVLSTLEKMNLGLIKSETVIFGEKPEQVRLMYPCSVGGEIVDKAGIDTGCTILNMYGSAYVKPESIRRQKSRKRMSRGKRLDAMQAAIALLLSAFQCKVED